MHVSVYVYVFEIGSQVVQAGLKFTISPTIDDFVFLTLLPGSWVPRLHSSFTLSLSRPLHLEDSALHIELAPQDPREWK